MIVALKQLKTSGKHQIYACGAIQEDMMVIKLIAIDMHGTLLNHKYEISPVVKEAIGAVRGKGICVALAIGRSYIGL